MTSLPDAALLRPVDLSDLADGNTGIAYAHRFESGNPGPEILVTALVHGNELCGAHALRAFFDAAIRPTAGAITCCFCNIEAYDSFDPVYPVRARFIDEDFNRVWDPQVLDGPRHSVELARARELRPLLEKADILLDLHSMQSDSEPLMLSGTLKRSRELAVQIGFPGIVVADPGHAAGLRMRDYGAFGAAAEQSIALLAECGQHLDPQAAINAKEILARFLVATGTVTWEQALALSPMPDRPRPRTIEVTDRITVRHGNFRFEGQPQSLDIYAEAGTLIGMDGDQPVRTPYDNCVMIMPSRRLTTGQTAVRLGRYVD